MDHRRKVLEGLGVDSFEAARADDRPVPMTAGDLANLMFWYALFYQARYNLARVASPPPEEDPVRWVCRVWVEYLRDGPRGSTIRSECIRDVLAERVPEWAPRVTRVIGEVTAGMAFTVDSVGNLGAEFALQSDRTSSSTVTSPTWRRRGSGSHTTSR